MILAVIVLVLVWLLRIYTYVLWGRFIIDWVRVLAPRFRPRGALIVVFEVIFTVTDPPIRFFRRVLPPIRLGQIALDLGWMLTMLSCWILIAVLRVIPV
ncbi:YggT family protein [Leucobacter weissii]|uniref:YggT family protein n=1 Tax=Leucobacter weissii TaxID=1983706 RepID=A0A939MND2_9MICO|nr:YggT family protein [Leucobacter weissii]MBO1901997.1 YggT family protein [Leucobacter weissii]